MYSCHFQQIPPPPTQMTKKENPSFFQAKKTKLSGALPNICCLSSFFAHKRKKGLFCVIVALPSPLSVPRSLLEPVLFYWRRQPSLPWLSLSLLSLSLSLFLSVSGLLVDRERKEKGSFTVRIYYLSSSLSFYLSLTLFLFLMQ